RPAFYRRTTLIAAPLSRGGLLAGAVALAVSVWIGFFAFRRVEYQDALWWTFSLKGNASRFLRATLAASVLLLWVAFLRLFAPPRASGDTRTLPPEVAAQALALTDRTDASLALG